jgi:hypothetical protein
MRSAHFANEVGVSIAKVKLDAERKITIGSGS